MNDLQLIMSYLDSNAAEQVLALASNQHFWFLRTEALVGKKLNEEEGENWRQAYSILTRSMNLDNEEDDPLPVSIRLQLGVDPSQNGNNAIRSASESGHHRIVELLLSDSRIDPSVEDNEPIRYASESGHTEIVRLLLQDRRVDPSANDNYALITASMDGHIEVVRLLLQDRRVDSRAQNCEALRLAIANEHSEVATLLQ